MMEPHTQGPTKVKALSLNRDFKVSERQGPPCLELRISTTLNGLTFYASTHVSNYTMIHGIERDLERSLMGEIRKALFAGVEL